MGRNVNLKLAVYGEKAVGKTSLVNVFLGKEVPKKYSPTINSKVGKKDYVLKKAGVTFKLNIWDVGGNRAVNPTINNAFYSDVDLVLMVFDLTRPELTLKAHKKNFLDRINRYSEEPLTLIVGNKLDKLLFNNDFKKAIQNYLGENKSFSITSATSKLNVNNCFELLLYTFLKKSEILLPDLVPENSGLEFIEIIGKSEDELKGQLVNLATIDLKHRDLKPKIKITEVPSQEEDRKKKYHEFIQQELHKISHQKGNLTDKFLENILEMERKLNQLKKQNIKSSTDLVDKLKISLESSKNNCEQHLKALIKLNREENELIIISAKIREDKLADLPKKMPTTLKVKPKTPEAKAKPKPEPKPLEVKAKPKPEPKPLEVKAKPKPEPKPLEVKAKPKPELKPLEVKAKPKLEPKPLEVKVKSKSEAKPKPTRLKEVKIASKPIKKDPKIELYNKYEKINPGKRAVYRGKETKGFLEWKKQNS